MQIKNKKILITGGANGIGFLLANTLIKKDAIVIILDKDKNKIVQIKKEIKNYKKKLHVFECDISKKNNVDTSIKNVFKLFNSIDILINNAAILKDSLLISCFKGKIKKLPLENWESVINTNLNGAMYVTREIVERMVLKRIEGLIINVSSVSSYGNPGQSAYAATKAGLNALTVTWSQELHNFGIRVAGLSPGITNTDMPKQSLSKTQLEIWKKRIPLKRFATINEIVKGFIFIIENNYFTGKTLEIDGGLRL